MKFYVYISDPESWLQNTNVDPEGDPNAYREHYIQVTTSEGMGEHGWVLVDEFERPAVNVPDDELRKMALEKIDKAEKRQVAENEVKMQGFEDRRSALLAITHQPDVEGLIAPVVIDMTDGGLSGVLDVDVGIKEVDLDAMKVDGEEIAEGEFTTSPPDDDGSPF